MPFSACTCSINLQLVHIHRWHAMTSLCLLHSWIAVGHLRLHDYLCLDTRTTAWKVEGHEQPVSMLRATVPCDKCREVWIKFVVCLQVDKRPPHDRTGFSRITASLSILLLQHSNRIMNSQALSAEACQNANRKVINSLQATLVWISEQNSQPRTFTTLQRFISISGELSQPYQARHLGHSYKCPHTSFAVYIRELHLCVVNQADWLQKRGSIVQWNMFCLCH